MSALVTPSRNSFIVIIVEMKYLRKLCKTTYNQFLLLLCLKIYFYLFKIYNMHNCFLWRWGYNGPTAEYILSKVLPAFLATVPTSWTSFVVCLPRSFMAWVDVTVLATKSRSLPVDSAGWSSTGSTWSRGLPTFWLSGVLL
jgi:hypothetical protein